MSRSILQQLNQNIAIQHPGIRKEGLAALISHIAKNRESFTYLNVTLEKYLAATIVNSLSFTYAEVANKEASAGIRIFSSRYASLINSVMPFDGEQFIEAFNQYMLARANLVTPNPDYRKIISFVDIVTHVQFHGTREENDAIVILNGLVAGSLAGTSLNQILYHDVCMS